MGEGLSFEVAHLDGVFAGVVVVSKEMEHPVDNEMGELCLRTGMKLAGGFSQLFVGEGEVAEKDAGRVCGVCGACAVIGNFGNFIARLTGGEGKDISTAIDISELVIESLQLIATGKKDGEGELRD